MDPTAPCDYLALFPSFDPRRVKRGDGQRRKKKKNSTEAEQSALRWSESSIEAVSFCTGVCCPADESEWKNRREGKRNLQNNHSIEARPESPDALMHGHICGHSPTFFPCARTHTDTQSQLKDFWPICTCMQANQGLFADRKQRVTEGEMFVMEIWTAGV